MILFAPMLAQAADMALRDGALLDWKREFVSFNFLELVLFEGIFVAAIASLCLALPREREVQRL